MYTLWLIPDNNTYNKLSDLIVGLSSLHDTPQFEPHVTLLGGIVDPLDIAIEKTEKLAKQLAPISASLTRTEFLEIDGPENATYANGLFTIQNSTKKYFFKSTIHKNTLYNQSPKIIELTCFYTMQQPISSSYYYDCAEIVF